MLCGCAFKLWKIIIKRTMWDSGLKETLGTNGTLEECVQRILEEGLGVQTCSAEFKLEKIHRLLAPTPDLERPPRPVLIRFLRQSAKEKEIYAAKEKLGLVWEGCRLSIFPDMTKELADKRKSFTAVRRKLREMDVKYTLAYPATLWFKLMGKNMSFIKATAVQKFINNDQDEDWTFKGRNPSTVDHDEDCTFNKGDDITHAGVKSRRMFGGLCRGAAPLGKAAAWGTR